MKETTHVKNLQQLTAWTCSLAYVTRETPVRLSVAQLATFALAALGDRMGQPVTLTQLRETLEGTPGGGVHTTYSIFFEQHKGQPQLGWLWQERCEEDLRVKFLRLGLRGPPIITHSWRQKPKGNPWDRLLHPLLRSSLFPDR